MAEQRLLYADGSAYYRSIESVYISTNKDRQFHHEDGFHR